MSSEERLWTEIHSQWQTIIALNNRLTDAESEPYTRGGLVLALRALTKHLSILESELKQLTGSSVPPEEEGILVIDERGVRRMSLESVADALKGEGYEQRSAISDQRSAPELKR